MSLLQVLGLLARVFCVSEDWTLRTRGCIDVDIAEKELGLSGASTETILSLLELEPLQLISVETNQFDTLSGRIHDPSSGSATDMVLSHLLRLNERVNPASSSSDQGLQYSGKDFSVSLLELSIVSNIPIDKLTSLLYAKQKEGVLVYRLSGASIYFEVKVGTFKATCAEEYTAWLLEIATALHAKLRLFVQQCGDRVLDMYRVGMILTREDVSNDRKMNFICSYLEGKCQNFADCKDKELLDTFLNADNPVLDLSLDSKRNSSYDAVVQCRRNVAIAMRNPVITGLSNTLESIILSHIEVQTVRMAMKSVLIQSCVDFRAVCAAHVLHGHTSKFISAGEWSDCEFWGRFRNVSFESIVTLAASLLTK